MPNPNVYLVSTKTFIDKLFVDVNMIAVTNARMVKTKITTAKSFIIFVYLTFLPTFNSLSTNITTYKTARISRTTAKTSVKTAQVWAKVFPATL